MAKQTPIRFNWLMAAMLFIFWAACASFYPSLPDQMPSHWNIQGEVDGYSHKSVVALVMPLLPLGLYVAMTFLPKIDPKGDNYGKFAPSYEKIRLAIVLVMMVVTLLPLLAGLGYNVDIGLLMRIVMPLLFIVLGNYMGKIRFNYFMGIRLPWTLANEEVWNKTHRLGGKLMVAGGIVALLGVFAPPATGFVLVMSGIFVPIVVSALYSFLTYRKLTGQ